MFRTSFRYLDRHVPFWQSLILLYPKCVWILLDDLSLGVIHKQICVSRFFALAFCSVSLCIPHCFCNGQVAVELSHRTVDCNSFHNGDSPVFSLLLFTWNSTSNLLRVIQFFSVIKLSINEL